MTAVVTRREVFEFDVVVVGAGAAGLVAALDLSDLAPGVRIVVIDKGTVGSTGSTPLAQEGAGRGGRPGRFARAACC
jgi:succinate dehydrogenase/fumarate reductase flavoprotein subunit